MQSFAASLLSAALLFGQITAQDAPKPPQVTSKDSQGLYRLRVETELVLVNVVVRDKQGKLVSDLKRGDFTLLEEGKPQTISSFDFESLDTVPLAAAGPAASGEAQTAANKPILSRKDAEEALSNKRAIVLFFDLGSMSPDETERAVDAAR
ncbi:MAG TPA: VWA domain-containing protein, partial [Candidatus Angelobacter sp.]|nr:VWA domain-containing protein [Candidatus Angelobacter sp.]